MEQYFDIGGAVVRVTAPDGAVHLGGTELEKFLIQPAPWQTWLDIAFRDDLPDPEGELIFESPERRVWVHGEGYTTLIGGGQACLWINRRGPESKVIANRKVLTQGLYSQVLMKALEAEHLIVAGDGFLLHSSFIEYRGRAILFTAPSGTGKSTQAALWQQLRGARIINGDRSVVRRGGAGFEAYGVPFCGSSRICEPARLPLAAIVVLSQAKQTTIIELHGLQAFRSLWEGCSLHTWNRVDVARCTQTVADAISQIPIYHLACTPDESAVIALESKLRK